MNTKTVLARSGTTRWRPCTTAVHRLRLLSLTSPAPSRSIRPSRGSASSSVRAAPTSSLLSLATRVISPASALFLLLFVLLIFKHFVIFATFFTRFSFPHFFLSLGVLASSHIPLTDCTGVCREQQLPVHGDECKDQRERVGAFCRDCQEAPEDPGTQGCRPLDPLPPGNCSRRRCRPGWFQVQVLIPPPFTDGSRRPTLLSLRSPLSFFLCLRPFFLPPLSARYTNFSSSVKSAVRLLTCLLSFHDGFSFFSFLTTPKLPLLFFLVF